MRRVIAMGAAVALSACASNETDIMVGVYSALPFSSDALIRGVCVEVESRGLQLQRVVVPVVAGVPPRSLFDFRIIPRDEDLSQPINVTVVGRTRPGCSMGLEVARRSRQVRFIPAERVRETFVLGGSPDPTPDASVDGSVDVPIVRPDTPDPGGCPAGLSNCGGTCTNTRYDPRNCGGCGMVCGDTTFCVNGACSCPAGQQICDGRRCTDPRSDPDWCGPGTCGGACQMVVNGNRGCQAGRCVYTCNPGFEPVGGRCVHCGLMGELPCDTPMPCASGLMPCGDGCRNLATDRNHCGACNAQCAPVQNCAGGTCR
jgi:hypothetical protein